MSWPGTGEVDRGAPLAGRRTVEYWCHADHRTTATLSDEAEAPDQWQCVRCGAPASQDRGTLGPPTRTGFHRTPYEFLMMRRTEKDGERLLDEALAELRNRKPGQKTGPTSVGKSSR